MFSWMMIVDSSASSAARSPGRGGRTAAVTPQLTAPTGEMPERGYVSSEDVADEAGRPR